MFLKSIRPTACLGFLLAAAPFAFCQKSFVFPHALERDGSIVAIGWDLSGGQNQFRWIVDGTGPVITRTIAPIGALYSLYGNEEIYQMVAASLGGKEWGYNYSIYSVQKGVAQVGLGVAGGPSVSEVRFPACDVDSKEPAGVEVYFNPREYSRSSMAGEYARSASQFAKTQKLWSQSSFRVTIGDLPCAKMRKVGPITIRVQPPNHNPEARIGQIEFDTEIGLVDSGPFREALSKTVAGPPQEYPFRLEYLDDDGNVLLSLITMVVIESVDKANPLDAFDPADPENGEKPIKLKWTHRGHVTVLK